ncbi:hypothetical protein DXV76_20800 [Rhodobacteraceae bacterium CCMM004]|nr:hypothetical protein DXV76_20800 [Rhodobacteraceae bacterium CCMM004]
MPEIKAATLVIAIQAVKQRIDALEAAQKEDGVSEEEMADLDEMLLAHDTAAEDLKRAYDAARETDAKLPQYGWLTR